MRIKVRRSWKEDIEKKPHRSLTRRDFLSRGMLTGAATVMLPHAILAGLARQAFAGETSCPPQTRAMGALAQIYRQGGPTVGAMFVNETQAGFMSSAVATRYGIIASDLTKIGANYYVAKSSPFAVALMTPPPGFSQSQWNAVLAKTSLGGHYGAFNADDGAGQNSGLMGAGAPIKTSQMGKDLRVNTQSKLATWAQGAPSTGISGSASKLTPAAVAKNFGITPSGGTTSQLMTNSAQAADSLSQIFMNMFGLGRTDVKTAVSKAVCGFYGDSAMADPNYGNSLFNPTAISALSSKIQVGNLTGEEQSLLAAYYQSAIGTIGGVFVEQPGCDYHGSSVQNTISPSDFEAGRMFAMFLAACAVAGTKGAMISLHNGQAIANGTQGATVNGNSVNGPVATGDAGGSYNAGFILCYDPSSPPVLKTTGTFNTSNGNVTVAASVGTSQDSVAGLYLTAFSHLGLNMNAAAALMQKAGAASNVNAILLI